MTLATGRARRGLLGDRDRPGLPGQRTAVGTVEATEARDYTVKLDATDLEAGTTWYYRFHAQGRASAIGRTRTAPTGGVSGLRFAVVSCASLAHGFFHAYRHVAERADLDAVIHLGDYIYEYGSGQYGSTRPYEPAHEITTLEDYRVRYRQYRWDADLRPCTSSTPSSLIWDDHETREQLVAGRGREPRPRHRGAWANRAAAIQAWYEWLPVRETADHHIYRRLRLRRPHGSHPCSTLASGAARSSSAARRPRWSGSTRSGPSWAGPGGLAAR
ncbi:MAG: alkaline phosphatase D family protein [bacterium]